MKKAAMLLSGLLAIIWSCGSQAKPRPAANNPQAAESTHTSTGEEKEEASSEPRPGEISRLTEQDYREVAERLGVEVAAIKAVVDIEAGRQHEGFSAPGMPLINFDLTMFRRFAGKKGINLAKYQRTHAVVFSRPNARKYGSQQAAQHARLKAARTIDNTTAIEGTFWGMFQIGGFNWKKCGCRDINDFVDRMSRSERDQLDLFANFIESSGLLKYLRAKNWSAFAKGYNGPSYASRGYHTRLAQAYARHKR